MESQLLENGNVHERDFMLLHHKNEKGHRIIEWRNVEFEACSNESRDENDDPEVHEGTADMLNKERKHGNVCTSDEIPCTLCKVCA